MLHLASVKQPERMIFHERVCRYVVQGIFGVDPTVVDDGVQ